jgi:PAS domain S-box-containing protein
MGEHVEALLGAGPDALVGVGREAMVPSVDRRTEQLFGHECDDLVEPLVAESARPAPKVHVRCCLTISSIYKESGAVIGAAATPRNMAALQHGFDSARSMIKSSLDSLVAISAQGKVTEVKEAAATVAGVPRDKLIGTSFSKHFTDPEKADRIYKLVSSHSVALDYALTMGHRGGDPHRGPYNASVHHDAEGKVVDVFAPARDVPRQVHSQREVAEQQAREHPWLAKLERSQTMTIEAALKMIGLREEIETLKGFNDTEAGESDDQW